MAEQNNAKVQEFDYRDIAGLLSIVAQWIAVMTKRAEIHTVLIYPNGTLGIWCATITYQEI